MQAFFLPGVARLTLFESGQTGVAKDLEESWPASTLNQDPLRVDRVKEHR
jgi:hypothetical protein